MGRGDKKSRKGKIFRGSYGVVRPRKTKAAISIPTKKKEVTKEPEKVVRSLRPREKIKPAPRFDDEVYETVDEKPQCRDISHFCNSDGTGQTSGLCIRLGR